MLNTWNKIYKKEENLIHQVWNEEIRNDYEMERNAGTFNIDVGDEVITIPINLREHYDMAFGITEVIENMDELNIKQDKVLNVIRKMKNKKCPGPDKMKIEIYKEITKDLDILKLMTKTFNKLLEEGNPPESWTKSITKMIQKKTKPTAKDWRPIALTDCTYKIFMSVIRDSIEDHICSGDLQKDQQSGFTKKRRIEDNLIMLNYCVEGTYRVGGELYIAAIDYSKAFDSINRKHMIETLKNYKIDPAVINVIARIYSQDSTTIHLREDFREEIEIGNGIRQGCTGSTVLFKLVTFMIIKELEKEIGYKFRDLHINCLFFADDGIIIEQSEERLIKTLGIMNDVSKKFGLEINKNKSNILIFNSRNRINNICDIPVVEEIKYLGVFICNKRNIFTAHKHKMMQKAQRMANLTYSVIYKSVNKVLIGSTFWKNVVLPSILFGSSIIIFNQEDIKKLQRIENAVLRKILGAQRFAPIATLRGEVGSSLMESRIMKEKISYLKYAENSDNQMLRRVMVELREGQYKWFKQVESYMIEVNIRNIGEESKETIKKKIYEYDTRKWREEMETKSSLHIYKNWKKEIKQSPYRNNFQSVLLFKLRSNTLNLEVRNRFKGESTICKMCNEDEEDLFHFMLHCRMLQDIRINRIELQRPIGENEEATVGDFLFEGEDQMSEKNECN